MEVVAASDTGARASGGMIGGEDILPDPFSAGMGVFALQGRGEVDESKPVI
jgi:hypothetical protein